MRYTTLPKLAMMTLLTLTAGTVALSAQEVRTDYDHKANFGQYHTFSIYKLHASDQIVEGRLRDDIHQALTSRGYREVPEGGDLAITAVGGITNKQEYSTFYNGLGGGYGYGGWGGWRGFGGWGGGGGTGVSTTRAYNVPVGTLAIDAYDRSSKQLVFRGTASDTLSKKSEKNASKLEKAVDKIFDKLPKSNG
ncbi:hypothetical protein Terro_1948 [Terriglobus roseus DSM 18391]|uniref:DUF4136 domain-containing protein n=1 Tax=Terriglobus roseus (strain DSM 18391 / NRRL B-41598 / KBS 63) TaxID=926566 RepID=I3ZG66_TERRK|nr:DUF4136 domain-containing protein [Terriglobus roseus]AFL88234.1 hypothetical protein Terro_1948 [Terriglobus roseus DSM 18391]